MKCSTCMRKSKAGQISDVYKRQGVDIRLYSIIYDAIEEVKSAMEDGYVYEICPAFDFLMHVEHFMLRISPEPRYRKELEETAARGGFCRAQIQLPLRFGVLCR